MFRQYQQAHYNLAMIDLDAPIVPAESAAGVSLGSVVNEVLAGVHSHSTEKVSSGEKHDLGAVQVWTKDGVVIQVGVFSGYRGVLQPGIRVGSTISEVEDSFGCSVQEDEEDNLVVATSPGWCFETEEWRNPKTVDNNRYARIVSIFFSPAVNECYGDVTSGTLEFDLFCFRGAIVE
jgi:hypothetical protein